MTMIKSASPNLGCTPLSEGYGTLLGEGVSLHKSFLRGKLCVGP